jgi:hypothetical protein
VRGAKCGHDITAMVGEEGDVSRRRLRPNLFRRSRMAVIWPILPLVLLAGCAPASETVGSGPPPSDFAVMPICGNDWRASRIYRRLRRTRIARRPRRSSETPSATIREYSARVERGGRRPNLALDYRGDRSRPIGRCMQQDSGVGVPAWDAIVVLKASRHGGGF